MKTLTIYECEVCHRKSENKTEISTCESSHGSMTERDYAKYVCIRNRVKTASANCCITHCEETEKEFDEAISELINFEKTYGITV